ncbi:MAG: hypothetical protein Q7T03_03790 [Deltaproteobacteria bacterium]|nr:hypothetical protein [Deltaproteobacteria bacterium]
MRLGREGHAALEYLLVVAVLVLGMAVALYRPAKNGRNLGSAFKVWHQDLTERIAKP